MAKDLGKSIFGDWTVSDLFTPSKDTSSSVADSYIDPFHRTDTPRGYKPTGGLLPGWDFGIDGVPYNPKAGSHIPPQDDNRGASYSGGGGGGASTPSNILTPQTFDNIGGARPEGIFTRPDAPAPEPYVYGAEPYTYGEGLNTAGSGYDIWGTPESSPNPYYYGQEGLFGTTTVPNTATLGLPPVTLPGGIPSVPSASIGISGEVDPTARERMAEMERLRAFREPGAGVDLGGLLSSLFGGSDTSGSGLFDETPYEFDDSEIEYLLDEPGTFTDMGDAGDPLAGGSDSVLRRTGAGMAGGLSDIMDRAASLDARFGEPKKFTPIDSADSRFRGLPVSISDAHPGATPMRLTTPTKTTTTVRHGRKTGPSGRGGR